MSIIGKVRFRFLITVAVVFFFGWLTEDILHLGIYDWFENTFGNQYGFLFFLLFWLIILGAIWQILKSWVMDTVQRGEERLRRKE